jgi:hypothetical protein
VEELEEFSRINEIDTDYKFSVCHLLSFRNKYEDYFIKNDIGYTSLDDVETNIREWIDTDFEYLLQKINPRKGRLSMSDISLIVEELVVVMCMMQ